MRIVMLNDRRRCGVGSCSPYVFVCNVVCISKFLYICAAMRVVNIFLITIVGLCLTVLASTSCVSQDDNVECVDVEHIAEPEITSDTITLLFGGDLMQHIPQIRAARRGSGFDYGSSFQYVAPMFRAADVAVLNFETTMTRTDRYTGYPRFRSPVALADAVNNLGVDIALLANNHCLDGGPMGVAMTIEEFQLRDIITTGVFRSAEERDSSSVVYFERRGVRFALINYTYGTNGLVPTKGIVVNSIDEERIKQDISNINRDGVDCLIACMHWGMEYQRRANDEQRTLAKMLKQEGVDIIIGSHPHVVQGYEADSTGVVFYSLGNLVSNQRRRYCNGGLLAEVKVIRCDTVDNLQYMATAHPVYVSMPGYRLLPKSVGDTMRLSQSSRYSYDRFMSDTESLLSTEFK